MRIAWMFMGSEWARWREIVPTTRERLRDLGRVIKFYAFPRGTYPYHRAGHNPLAGLSYLFFYALSLAIMATGFALYSLEAGVGSYMRWFDFLVPLVGGAARARWLHHVLMWPALIFAMVHIYIVVFVARVEGGGIIDSMVTGRKVTKTSEPQGHA
jgi:Ni/Fe-hydrogenase 1 B-type cytochrome subunit